MSASKQHKGNEMAATLPNMPRHKASLTGFVLSSCSSSIWRISDMVFHADQEYWIFNILGLRWKLQTLLQRHGCVEELLNRFLPLLQRRRPLQNVRTQQGPHKMRSIAESPAAVSQWLSRCSLFHESPQMPSGSSGRFPAAPAVHPWHCSKAAPWPGRPGIFVACTSRQKMLGHVGTCWDVLSDLSDMILMLLVMLSDLSKIFLLRFCFEQGRAGEWSRNCMETAEDRRRCNLLHNEGPNIERFWGCFGSSACQTQISIVSALGRQVWIIKCSSGTLTNFWAAANIKQHLGWWSSKGTEKSTAQ